MKKLVVNTLFSAVDYFVLIVLNLLATPILIRHFGVDGYGAFVFLSIFSIYKAMSFFDLGMEGSLMTYTARFEAAGDRRRLQDSLSISVVYYAAIGCLLGLAIYAAAGPITSRLLDENALIGREAVLTSLSYISVNIFLEFLVLPFTAVLQGLRRYAVTKSVNSLINVLRYLLLIVAAVVFRRIDVAFLIITGLTFIRLLAVLVFTLRQPSLAGLNVHFDFALFRQLFNYSSILFVSRLVGLICNNIDKLLIWLYLAVSSMTVYDVIARPSVLLKVITGIITSALVPETARLREQNDRAGLQKLFIYLVRYSYLILLPIVVVLYVHMADLLRLWVGETFVPHAYLALILLSVYVILPIPSIASTMVVGLEKVRQTIWMPIVYTIINVALSLLLLRYLGLAGLLWATLAAELFYVFPYTRAMKRFLGFELPALVKPLTSIFGVAALALVIQISVRYLLLDRWPLMAALAVLLLAAHYGANYLILLDPREKSFLLDMFRAVRNGKAARAFHI